MITRLLAAGAACAVALGLASAGAASANASGFCTLSGKTAHLYVTEAANGIPSQVRIDSPYQLDLGTSAGSSSSWGLYSQAGAFQGGGYFVSKPIDGDGYWNYAQNILYDGSPLIGSVQFGVQRYASTASCGSRVYIS